MAPIDEARWRSTAGGKITDIDEEVILFDGLLAPDLNKRCNITHLRIQTDCGPERSTVYYSACLASENRNPRRDGGKESH